MLVKKELRIPGKGIGVVLVEGRDEAEAEVEAGDTMIEERIGKTRIIMDVIAAVCPRLVMKIVGENAPLLHEGGAMPMWE